MPHRARGYWEVVIGGEITLVVEIGAAASEVARLVEGRWTAEAQEEIEEVTVEVGATETPAVALMALELGANGRTRGGEEP